METFVLALATVTRYCGRGRSSFRSAFSPTQPCPSPSTSQLLRTTKRKLRKSNSVEGAFLTSRLGQISESLLPWRACGNYRPRRGEVKQIQASDTRIAAYICRFRYTLPNGTPCLGGVSIHMSIPRRIPSRPSTSSSRNSLTHPGSLRYPLCGAGLNEVDPRMSWLEEDVRLPFLVVHPIGCKSRFCRYS